MKRILLTIFVLTAAASIPRLTPSLSASQTWTLQPGLNFTPGLVFNRSWDPGYSSTAVTISLSHQHDSILMEAGVEAMLSYTGLNLLFPLQTGLVIADTKTIQFSTAVAFIPGIILSRPASYLLIAVELNARLTWSVTPKFSLSLSAGPRYTTSPEYSTVIAPLELIDITIGIRAGFRLGK